MLPSPLQKSGSDVVVAYWMFPVMVFKFLDLQAEEAHVPNDGAFIEDPLFAEEREIPMTRSLSFRTEVE